MELYIIRHGQSTNNALGTPVGRTQDPPLTDTGWRQARALAAHLAEAPCPESIWEERDTYDFDHLYCSAMQRALQTAQPVARALGLQPEVWIDVHEHGGIYLDGDNGQAVGYPGMTRGNILTQFPDYILPEAVTERGWWTGGFETVAAAAGRAIAVAEILLERARTTPGERVGIISHGGFANLLVKALLHQILTPHWYIHHYNTGITRLDIQPNGVTVLCYVNRISHLTPDLVTH